MPAVSIVASLVALALTVQAPAQKAPALSELMPGGTHVFVHADGRAPHSPEDERVARAARKLWDSGILRDFIELATIDVPAENRAAIGATIEQVFAALGKVDWAALMSSEIAIGYRLTIPMPESVMLVRVSAGDVERHLKGLRAMLDGLAALAPDAVEVRTPEVPGRVASLVASKQAMPIGLHLGNVGDVIVFSTSQPTLTSCLKMIRDGKGEGSLALDAKYRSAMEVLPKERDADGMIDIAGYCEFIASALEMAQGAMQRGSDSAPQVFQALTMVIDELSVVRVHAWTQKQVGGRTIHDGVVRFEPGSGDGLAAKLFTSNRTLEGFERLVPKDALACSANAGRDPSEVYDAVMKAVRESSPESAAFLDRFEAIQDRIGFHVRADVLAWLSGESACVTLPGAAMGSTECVWSLRVKDAKAAASAVGGALERARAFVESRGQEMRLEPLTGADGLRVVALDAFPSVRPVVGVSDGWLIVASSPDAAARVAAARRGSNPSILESPRLQSLNLEMKGQPVASFAFSDVEGELAPLAQIVSGAGFFMSMAPPQRKNMAVIRGGAILTKLGRFLRDADGPSTSASFTTPFGKDGVVRTHGVTLTR